MHSFAIQCASVAAMIAFAVVIDLVTNAKGRSRLYQVRRVANWLTAGGSYVIFYMARYAIVIINTESVRADLGVTPSAYGALLTCGFWSYALCTALGGGVVDRVGGRTALMCGAAGCSAFCAVAGVVLRSRPRFWLLLALNMGNLGCSTLAALAVIRINVDWYTKYAASGSRSSARR